jgi:hypothetical protein
MLPVVDKRAGIAAGSRPLLDMEINSEALAPLSLDLSKTTPRSPRELVGDYVVLGRTLDKCRAVLMGTNDEYHFDCPLDNFFFDFTGIQADAFKEYVATGASDEDVAAWVVRTAGDQARTDIVVWNNKMRYTRISEMPPELQLFLEDYIPEVIPAEKRHQLRYWFDVYDLEEGRM